MRRISTKGSLSPRERARERELKNLTARARILRRRQTDAEQLLWKSLRARRMLGYKFRRQTAIGSYIVDFVCIEVKLIIEADGEQHMEQIKYDSLRTRNLETRGYCILRFWNNEIFTELDGVLEQIERVLMDTPSPRPSP